MSAESPAAENNQGSTAGSSHAPSSLGRVVSNVGDRIQEILDTAERVADEIQAEAEAAGANYVYEQRREADRVVAERARELLELTESLSARAKQMESEAAALVESLEDAMRRMTRLAGSGEAAAPAPTPVSSPNHVPQAPAAVERPGAPDGDRIPEQAVLRATQMAVAGSERTEIERMLRVEFGIQDPMSVVDEMLRSERA